jgi:Uma2 family endonuclease
LTIDEYHRMGEAGILSEDERVELIHGEIYEMTPIGARHAACLMRLQKKLERALGDRAIVSSQNPLALEPEDSEPQPDLMLLRVREDFYARACPTPADVLLVVEIADSSFAWDRDVKLPQYARAGIAEAWLVDLNGDTLVLHREPSPEGYREVRTLRREEAVSPQAFEDVEIPVAEILPVR